MQKYRWHILIVVFIIPLGFIYFYTNPLSTLENDEFAIENPDDVKKIYINKDDQNIIIESVKGKWMVNQKYRAEEKQVRFFLDEVNRLLPREPVSNNKKDSIVKQLQKRGFFIRFADDAGHVIKAFYALQDTSQGNGTILMLQNSENPYYVYIPGSGYTVGDLFRTDSHFWRDRTLFPVKAPEIFSIQVKYPTQKENNYAISKDQGSYEISSPTLTASKNLEGFRVQSYLQLFGNMAFKEVATNTPDTVFKISPYAIIEVSTVHEKYYKLKTFPIPNLDSTRNHHQEVQFNPFYLIGLIDQDTILLRYDKLDRLLKNPAYFLKK